MRRRFDGSARGQAGQDGGDPDTVLASRGGGSAAMMKSLLIRAFASPKVRWGFAMWCIGFAFMVFSPSLQTTTPEMKKQYESMLVDAANIPEYEATYQQYAIAQEYANDAKVWFWRFREPYATQVKERQLVADQWSSKLAQMDAEREAKMKQARQYVGIWSDYGMADLRNRFWDAFDKGKVFAQQQTFYQMLMHVLSSREEDVVSTLVQWVFTALINFTTGLLGSLFYFFFSLLSMVYSYQPDPFSALAFFVLGFVGAASVISAYLIGMYGLVAGGTYAVGKMLLRDAMLEQEQRQRLRQSQW